MELRIGISYLVMVIIIVDCYISTFQGQGETIFLRCFLHLGNEYSLVQDALCFLYDFFYHIR